eukprot:CAMPEP_0170590960 /NCGR_PEP_ID=MMETSP0224-20130122/12147_1 /TAXON_ID=285029 /ORGANISM="Togula jolla, Strain CCCM 725" /LENGTH=42 /DNA_ID= /DNA_START= /DNA_END= /DNA_ORIENTATION=
MYLLAAMRAASSASLEICCNSSLTMCTAAGNSSQGIFFLPTS